MLFYKIEAEIVNARTFSEKDESIGAETGANRKKYTTFRGSEQWKNFKVFASQQSDDIYWRSNCKTYIFTVGVKNEAIIQLAIVSRCEVNTFSMAKDYLTSIDAEFINITAEEITIRAIIDLVQTGSRNELIKDDDEVLAMFGLDELTSRRNRNYCDYSETVYLEKANEKTLKSKASSLLCGDTLIPEIERIYQAPLYIPERGHPVHYMIECNDAEVTEQIIKALFSALYENKRIRSRRCCNIKYFDNGHALPLDFINALSRTCFGSVMVHHYHSDYNDDDEYATPDMDEIEKLCDSIKKYKNDVLTILCLPRNTDKTKNTFIEQLGSVTIIPIREDIVFGGKAKAYLQQLAKSSSIKTDKSLYSNISDDGKGYLASDLNIIFDKWFSKKLKTGVYQQYAAFESADYQVAKQKPKGDAYTEMDKMIGLADVKSVINQALDFFKAQKLFKDKGIPTENTAMHMVFTGNPGTAKTTAARLFAQIMKDNGLLSEGRLYEVGRADLVGKYVGWTAQIVKQKFRAARGSVLFIDEAYSLVDDKDGMFGDEAINTIVQEMENNREDMVVIFAGYPDKMESFLQKNPGLRSRIAFHVPFEDYNSEELYQITSLLAENKKMMLSPEVEGKLLPIFDTHMKQDDFGNGRFARNLLEKAQMKQASRLVSLDPSVVTKEDVMTLNADDFEVPELPSVQKKTIGFAQ